MSHRNEVSRFKSMTKILFLAWGFLLINFANAEQAALDQGCKISLTCPGATISCETPIPGRCDIGPNYVMCSWNPNQSIIKYCPKDDFTS